MRPDIYTKAVLTVIAIMLTLIALKPLISPAIAEAQGPLNGLQFGVINYDRGLDKKFFFDPRTGDIWSYLGKEVDHQKLTRPGSPLGN